MIKNHYKDRYIYILALVYLLSSLVFFLIGYVKYIFSIPLVFLLIISSYKTIKSFPKMEQKLFNNRKIYAVIFIIIIWVFYSGLDVVLFLLFSKLSFMDKIEYIITGGHMELILKFFNSSSNTTLLFWSYNQIIPFWVGMMLILLNKDVKSLLFIYVLIFLYYAFVDERII